MASWRGAVFFVAGLSEDGVWGPNHLLPGHMVTTSWPLMAAAGHDDTTIERTPASSLFSCAARQTQQAKANSRPSPGTRACKVPYAVQGP
ncbi:hypothetical protein ACOMHN_013035 [Nucella lapillus]